MRLDRGRAQIIVGVIGINLGVLAISILLAPMVWSERVWLALPAILGALLVWQSRILDHLNHQNRLRRALPRGTPGLRHLLAWSVLNFFLILAVAIPVVFSPWMDGVMGIRSLDWWVVGAVGATVCGTVNIGLRLWEADLIDQAHKNATGPTDRSDRR